MGERQTFAIHEDPDCHQDYETATTPTARSPTDPDQENPNAETIPGSQANVEHPVNNNNMPETPSTFASIGLAHMMLASVRQPVASTTGNFFESDDNADELHTPTSPSPADGHALPNITSADGTLAGESEAEALPIRNPRMNVGERLIRSPIYFASNDSNDHESFDTEFQREDEDQLTPIRNMTTFPPPLIGEDDGRLTSIGNARAAVFPLAQTPASLMPPPQTPASHVRPPQSPASRLLRRSGSTPTYVMRSTGTHDDGINDTPVARRLFRNPGTNLESTPPPNRNAWEPQLFRPSAPHTPFRPSHLRSVSFTPARNEDTEMASPSVATTPECQTGITGVSRGTTPECQTGETRVTTPENKTGETLVTTPENKTGTTFVTTPKCQTGGTPPTPGTPHSPRAWISPSRVTPDLMARTFEPPVYRDRDEPMKITPSPPGLEPTSPNDKEMEDVFWTPNKPRASSNVASPQRKNAAAQKPAPMEYVAPIVSLIPFGDAMALEFDTTPNTTPIRNPAPVQDAGSPGTTTVRTIMTTEITTTITTTPSPPESPVPARKTAANLRPMVATPHKRRNVPRRQVASTPQRKGKGAAEGKTNRRRTVDPVIRGGINRRQELRTSPRYSLRDSTRDIMPGTYSLTPARNKNSGAKSTPEKK